MGTLMAMEDAVDIHMDTITDIRTTMTMMIMENLHLDLIRGTK